MTGVPVYGARFAFSRLFADVGRVFAGAGFALPIGILVLGVAPITAASLPWWRSRVISGDDTFERVWVAVNTAKAAVELIGLSAVALLVAAKSLEVLTGAAWRELLPPRRMAAAFFTALGLTLMANGPALAAPLILSLWRATDARGLLGWAELADYLLVMTTVGVALPAAVAEQTRLLPAVARAFKLMRRLRWRVLSIGLAYLLVSGIATNAVALCLGALGISYLGPGLGLAALRMPTVLLGVVNQVILVSVFLQARRIADGPSAVELHEVFA